jgi:hypothetical protein
MNIRSFLVAYSQTAELMKPTVRAFDNPAKHTQAATMLGVALGQYRSNVASPQSRAMRFGIVRSITLDAFGSSPLPAFATNFRDRIHQRDQLRYVVSIGPRQRGRQRDAVGIREYVMLRARLAAIRGIGASLRPPKTARTDVLSTTARDQSIWSASSSFCRNTHRIFSQTPAACQSRNRRQQVMPDPHPISLGRYSQGMPVLSTNNIPVSAARLSIGFRPGFRRRRFLGGGNNGSISFHNPSSKIGRAMVVPPCTAGEYSQVGQPNKSPFC